MLDRIDRNSPSSANCQTAVFELSLDRYDRTVLKLASCAQWGDIDRVSMAPVNEEPYGSTEHTMELIRDGTEASPEAADELVTNIFGRCRGLCRDCARWEPIARGWPRDQERIADAREPVVAIIRVANS